MSKSKKRTAEVPDDERPGSIWAAMLGGGRTAIIIVGVVAAMGTGAWWAWQKMGPSIVENEEFRLDPDAITITPPPTWIEADIRAEVVRDGSLDRGLSMLDDDLNRQVADAFELHPWVAEVLKVTKEHPGRVNVELIYRRPVVVAKLEGSSNLELYPFDVDGVRLPEGDLSVATRRDYPRLAGVTVLPVVGGPADDPAVRSGVRLAAFLLADWSKLRLAQIVPIPATTEDPTRRGPPQFEILGLDGSRYIWGTAPQRPDEPASLARLERLRNLAAQGGSQGSAKLHDLRSSSDNETAELNDRYQAN